MYRIIFSILFALTISFSDPVYVTIDVVCTGTLRAKDTSNNILPIGGTHSYNFLYDPAKTGVIQYYDQPDYEMGILGQPYVPDCGGYPCPWPWYLLKDHPFPFPPKYGISSMGSLYSPCKNDTCLFLRIIDEEHMFALKFDEKVGGLPLDSFSHGTGCELVSLKEPYNDTIIFDQGSDLWLPDENDTCYAGFFFKFKVTRVADTPPFPNFISSLYVPDLNSNGYPEIAYLNVNQENGNSVVNILDINSGEMIIKIGFFNSDWYPKELSVMPDINGNYVCELSVLAVNKMTGMAQVRIKDGETGELLKKLNVNGLGPQPEPPDKYIK